MIMRHKRELAALVGDGPDKRLVRAAGELGAAVESMDKATQSILKAAEGIDDGAKTLAAAIKGDYARSLAQDIQEQVVRVYEACNFQDLAGQRIGKVIALLATLEHQVAAMLTRCDGGAPAPLAAKPACALINGPKLDGDAGHASQRDIDAMFG
jgi:chemotaxis protein CheZ